MTSEQQTQRDQIHTACVTTGFFYLTGHGVPPAEQDQILAATRAFLVDGTEAEKEELSITKNDHARGYQRIGDNVTGGKADWHEAIDLYAPSPFALDAEDQVLAGQNRFPSRPANFQSVVESWIQRLCALGLVVMRATAMGLKMSLSETENLLDQVRNSFWVLRCIGYPPLPSTHDGVSCGAHKDYGCFTFLHADSTRGSLQVYVPKDALQQNPEYHWIEANPIEGAFVVNIGEMWETWTNGLYKATLHRVIHKSDQYRISVPFFYEPAFDAIVAPLPAAINLQQRLQGNVQVEITKQPVQYGDFLTSKVAGNFSSQSNAQARDRY